MKDLIFASDLDRTLIYGKSFLDTSTPTEIVEYYLSQPQSFTSVGAFHHLSKLSSQLHFIPTTTRSKSQFDRVLFNYYNILYKYLIVDNGGTIYINGVEDTNWKSLINQKTAQTNLTYEEALSIFTQYESPTVKTKLSNGLIWVIITDKARQDEVDKYPFNLVQEKLQKSGWEITRTQYKIYIYPSHINKWNAISYIRDTYLNGSRIVTAGDSIFDYQMIKLSDYSIVPKGSELNNFYPKLNCTKSSNMFASLDILEYVSSLIK